MGRGWGDAEGRDGFRILRGRSRSGNRRTECEITATHPRKATYLHASLDVCEERVLAYTGDQSRSIGSYCHRPGGVQWGDDSALFEAVCAHRQRRARHKEGKTYAVLSFGRWAASMGGGTEKARGCRRGDADAEGTGVCAKFAGVCCCCPRASIPLLPAPITF